MDIYPKTLEYYCNWLDIRLIDLERNQLICKLSEERNKIQLGHTRAFDLYCFIKENQLAYSYNEKISDKKDIFVKNLNLNDIESSICDIESKLQVKTGHSVKFYFTNIDDYIDVSETIKLDESDFDDYLTFFKTKNPNIKDTSWVKEYFNELVKNGYCWGITENGKLVSVTDSPDVPYMRDTIVELGINTLPTYQNKGYAKKVCTAFISHILKEGKVPIWSCNAKNKASIKLAESLVFKKLADVLTISDID